MAFIEPCFGIGHNLSLICQMTSEDIKHQLIISIGEGRWLRVTEVQSVERGYRELREGERGERERERIRKLFYKDFS